MSRSRRAALSATSLLLLAGTGQVALPSATGAAATTGPLGSGRAAATHTVDTLHFKVSVGPRSSRRTCRVVGNLYTPRKARATKKRRVPAIMTTNGFGGSKDDQAGFAAFMAAKGYVVLSWSGLGFGGSGCKITLNDPAYDGRAASQLISYLGGARGIAFRDSGLTRPAPRLNVVRRDKRDHRGKRSKHDPRVGMIGGSYGGAVQLATASIDPRLDTIVPMITWNDLSYSLAPNNTSRTRGVTTSTPGAVKLLWGLGFSALGMVNGLGNAQNDPARLLHCPNFADFVCPALVTAGATGYFWPGDVASLRRASPTSYLSKVRIPTLLLQGQQDTLFNLNEAEATFRALRSQGTPVKMVWHSWGHSGSPAPGEFDLNNPKPRQQYETRRVMKWFAHHLQGRRKVSTGPRFAWFRDWVRYAGDAAPAYASSSTFPPRTTTRSMWLSGGGGLVGRAADVTAGAQSLVTLPAGAPSSINPLDVLGGYLTPVPPPDPTDGPGTFASWTGPALAAPVDVVGSPRLSVRLDAPVAGATQGAGPAGQLVLFAKVLDIAPDGAVRLIRGTEAPLRIPDVGRTVDVALPAIVHRFAPGHRIRLVLAGGSVNFRSGTAAHPVTVVPGPGQVLTLPVVR